MKRILVTVLSMLGVPLFICADIVSRDMSNPEGCPWRQGDWVSARGIMSSLDERAPQASPNSHTLRIQITFPARTFAFWDALPIDGSIPGTPKKITGWVRIGDVDNGFAFRFADHTGNSEPEINGKKVKLELSSKHKKGEWTFVELNIPPNWPMPLKFHGIISSNWGNRNATEKQVTTIDLCDVRIYTDVSEVPSEDRPVSAAVQFPAHGNIFYSDEAKPTANLIVGSWMGKDLQLEASVKVTSADGTEKTVPLPSFTCMDYAKQAIELPFTQQGAYKVAIDLKGLPKPQSFVNRYVVIPRPPKLTEEQKISSPYGLNIHSGTHVDYERLARLGFVWVRDYAFSYSWMVNARGNGAFAGWPWYPKIMEGISNAGLKVLPCLMSALKEDQDSPEPSEEWRRNMASIMTAFPNQMCWELDNEYDKDNLGYRYGRRHQVFAQISKAIAPENWVVEQGAAYIPVEDARTHIASGLYKDVDVLNGHRYCGYTPPEVNKQNVNTGQADALTSLLRDIYIEWVKVAQMDGKKRQTWITEWGWDTKAGQPVSEWEQAAYLQRGFMLGFACGIDKMFWYWYDDSPKAEVFFDGCGIFEAKPNLDPKPVSAAFAAFRCFLPEGKKYVGYANLSPNAMAHVFETEGKLIAAAFLINPENKEGLTIDVPPCDGMYDMFGTKLSGKKRELNVAPTWFVGLNKNDGWLLQTPMEVTSKHYLRSVPGEPIHLEVAQTGKYTVDAPSGWNTTQTDGGFTVTIPEGTPRGSGIIRVTGVNDSTRKIIPIDVDIIPEAFLKSHAVGFDGKINLLVNNQSSSRKRHVVRAEIPNGWEVKPQEAFTELDAGKSANVVFALTKSTTLRADAKEVTPKLVVFNEKGLPLDQTPIVPREWNLPHIKNLKMDGDLSDWPIESKVPTWMLLPRGDQETANIHFGYAPEGLYIGVDMKDSKAFVADPTAFWRAADCMEIMFGPVANFKEGSEWTKTDRQFWLCPLVDQNRVYLGNWSRHESVKAESDIKVQSAAKRTDGGYVMEILIPAEQLGEWHPKKGAEMAMSFTIAVQGLRNTREVCWPASKVDNMVSRPWMWGRIKLD